MHSQFAINAPQLVKNSCSNYIHSNFSEKIIQEFIFYLYNGTIQTTDADELEKILKLANFFHLEALKALAVHTLIDQLNLSNVIKIFEITLRNKLQSVKGACSFFIAW